ncbi:thiolase family protein [Comamonadaceae bacterium G21597-S1]|nr:thiolase family protein [Comamonadaceae bacterium G21597-S1]
MAGHAAITGLGMVGLTRDTPGPADNLACQAVLAAMADAGLDHADVDGLIVCRSGAASESDLGLALQRTLALRDLSLLQVLHGEGTSVVQAVQTAAMAVHHGAARQVAVVFADAPMQAGRPASKSFGRIKSSRGIGGLRYAAGLFGGASVHALAARRHMEVFGTREEHFGAVAIHTRRWAMMNPQAVLRDALTMEEYLAARWIAEPLRLYDCAMPVNGAIAVIVGDATRAATDAHEPVYILGFGQGHPGTPERRGFEPELHSGAAHARDIAFDMAGLAVRDVDLCQIYDAFSYMTLLTLEEYGFCRPGEGGAFIASGATGPGGSLPVNTGGGHLSGFYLQGMTPLAEGVIQARGQAGERQCARHDVVLVTNEGGRFDHHACVLLSPHRDAQARRNSP